MAKVKKVRRGGVTFNPPSDSSSVSNEANDPDPKQPALDLGMPMVIRNVSEFDQSESLDSLAPALVKFRQEARNIGKDKDGYNYKYATLGNTIDQTQPILAKHGLAVMQCPVMDARGLGVITLLIHSSGQYIRSRFTMPIPSLSGTNATQDAGAAISYARRYAFSAILCLAAEDTDAEFESTPRKKKRAG